MPIDNDKPQLTKLPAIRKGITCTFSEYDAHGSPHWMLSDPGRNKFFIIGWAENQIYEHWHLKDVDSIVEAINNKTTLNIERSDVESFFLFLKRNYLIQQSGYDIHNIGKEQRIFSKDNWITWLIHHYLFFRIPFWHPDKFLIRTRKIGSFIFNRYFFYFMLILGLTAIYQISLQWDLFKHTFPTIFTLNGVIYYFFAFSICKFCHEMGHAYMCRRYNIPVQSLGVAFLVFWPVLYTDTTLSWVLKSKQRMRIALAGIWIESYVTIIAALIWCNTDSLTIKSVCYMTITVNWIGSLLINVSPFMRFDGYYILADYLRMPNLQPRAFALTRWQIRRWLFAWSDPPPEVYSKHLRHLLIAYSLFTWIYRLVLYLGIAVLVYHFVIKMVGIILFIIEVYYFILGPFINEVRTWIALKDRFSWNINTRITVTVFCCGILLFFIPIRSTITLPGTLSYRHEFIVAQEEGMIDKPLPKPGSIVKKGEVITELKSVDLENGLKLVTLEYKLKLMQLRNEKINMDDNNEKNIILSDINKSESEYNKLYSLYDKLTLRSPINGTLYETAPDLSVGVYVMKNEWIADVTDTSSTIVEVYVNESDLYLIKLGLTGYFYPRHLSQAKIPVRVIEINTLNTTDLSCEYSKALKTNKVTSYVVDTPCYNSSDLGGGIATYLTDEGKHVPVKSIYLVKLLPEKPMKLSYIERGNLVLNTAAHSYATKTFYWIKDLFIKQTGF